MFAAISSTVKIVSFSPISASVETDSRDFVLGLSCLNWLFCFSSYEFGHLLLQGPRTSEETADRPCDLCRL